MSRGRKTAAPTSYRTGLRGEVFARWFLRAKGYRVLARRFRCPAGEIDLIVRRGRTIAFVEVKARPEREQAAYAVTARQRRRIARAAAVWCAQNPPGPNGVLRFDVVLLARRSLPLHMRAAFEADLSPGGW